MADLYPKFIIEDGKLILSKVSYHKDIATNDEKVKGGGWFRFDKDTNTFLFYGSSFDFGAAKMEDIKACIDAGEVYSNKFLFNNISQKHNFSYALQIGMEATILKQLPEKSTTSSEEDQSNNKPETTPSHERVESAS